MKTLIAVLTLCIAACQRAPANHTSPSPVVSASTTDGPSPRSGAGLAYDSRRSKLVLFGGSDTGFKPLGDTWEWSKNRWTRVAADAPARGNFAMAYDSWRGRVVVFGGSTATGKSHDTWEFDGLRWTQVDTGGPPARNLMSMAFDEKRGRMVMFGGAGTRQGLGDTWEWDGTSWRAMPAGDPGPAARGSHTLVYDANRQRVVLVGGFVNSAVADSWEWDGATWARVADGPLVLHHAAAYDPRSKRLLVFGGFVGDKRTANLWARDGTSWNQLTGDGPPARAEHRGAYVPGLGFVIFGGIGGTGMSVEERGRSKLSDLWAFDGVRWQELSPGR
jgi:hypothetical protein